MKKTINLKLVIPTAIIAVIIAILAIMILTPDGILGIFSSNQEMEFEYGTLTVGRYMHTSGDPNKFVEVFEDGTIQISGYDLVEQTRNHPANKNRELSEEDKEYLEEHVMKHLEELEEYLSQRHPYTFVVDLNFVRIGEAATGLGFIDEKTLGHADEDDIYILAE
jgi:hypothetical protein